MATLDQLMKEIEVKPEQAAPETKDETQTTETTTTEVAPEEGATPATKTEQAPTIDRYGILSETLGRQFASDDDIETFKSSLTTTESKLKDYETREQQWAAEREELAKGVDPMSFFASPELFVLNGLLKKFPEKNPLALTQISTQDFSKTYLESPVEVLALDLMLEHPGIYATKAEAIEDIYAKYSIDDPEEIGAQAKRRMQVDAKTATDKFAGIKAQIEIPAKVDLNATKAEKEKLNNERITKMTAATEPLFRKTIPALLNEVTIPVTIKTDDGKETTEVAFKYQIPEGYAKSKDVQAVLEQVRNATIQNEAEWTEAKEAKLKQDVSELLLANYYYKHRAEIDAARVQDLQAKFADEAWMKRHNVRPLRVDGKAPQADPKQAKLDENQKEIMKSLGIKV